MKYYWAFGLREALINKDSSFSSQRVTSLRNRTIQTVTEGPKQSQGELKQN